MVTITYSALNDLTHDVAEKIEEHVGLGVGLLDLPALNNALTRFLDSYGVQYDEEEDDE